MIDEVIKTFGNAQTYKEKSWGCELSHDEVIRTVENYMQRYNLKVKYFFGKSLVTTMSNNGLSLVGKPNYYRNLRLVSLLDHEIGTHYLRS